MVLIQVQLHSKLKSKSVKISMIVWFILIVSNVVWFFFFIPSENQQWQAWRILASYRICQPDHLMNIANEPNSTGSSSVWYSKMRICCDSNIKHGIKLRPIHCLPNQNKHCPPMSRNIDAPCKWMQRICWNWHRLKLKKWAITWRWFVYITDFMFILLCSFFCDFSIADTISDEHQWSVAFGGSEFVGENSTRRWAIQQCSARNGHWTSHQILWSCLERRSMHRHLITFSCLEQLFLFVYLFISTFSSDCHLSSNYWSVTRQQYKTNSNNSSIWSTDARICYSHARFWSSQMLGGKSR